MSHHNRSVWLIEFTQHGTSVQVVSGHNSVGDYRQLDPAARATEIDITRLITAGRSAQAALQSLAAGCARAGRALEQLRQALPPEDTARAAE